MRYYQLFKDKKEQAEWEAQKKAENAGFKVCMRMTAKQLKDDLPFVNIEGYTVATIWREE